MAADRFKYLMVAIFDFEGFLMDNQVKKLNKVVLIMN